MKATHTIPTGNFIKLSDQSGLSGLRQMSHAVYEVVRKTVEDYRDDLNTLLAFAGLFSAILTALLIQSSTMLAPDYGYESHFPRRRHNAHAWKLPAGPSSSITHLSSPALDALLWAPYVTTLWFASLICSLGTAFTAMFLKRWLCEHNDTVLVWKRVLAIAAALPWVLQAAHGLFILGLGVFTAAIDEHKEGTTTILVIYWGLAVLVVATDIGLFVYPRYSHKLASLKPILETCHHVLSSLHTRLSILSVGIARTISQPILPVYDEDPKSASRTPLLSQQHARYGQQLVQQAVQPTIGCDVQSYVRTRSISNGQQPREDGIAQQDVSQACCDPDSTCAPLPQAVHQQLSLTYRCTSDGQQILFYVTALYDYQAVIDEEFDFKSGDIIAVTATPEDGWWSGTLHDTARAQSGRHIFPSTFVRRLRPEFAPCHKEEQ